MQDDGIMSELCDLICPESDRMFNSLERLVFSCRVRRGRLDRCLIPFNFWVVCKC